MTIWLAYVNYPITTAVYLKRALEELGHRVRTVGPRLPEEAIELWGLQNMHLPLDALDIDTDFAPDMAEILAGTPPADRPELYLWVESVNGYRPQNLHLLPCPKGCWLIDTHYHLATAQETARQFDYVFIAQLVDLDAFRAAHSRVYWLPLACDPGIHGRQAVAKRHEVGFVGSMNPRREEMLNHLAGQFEVHRERSFWTDMARTFSASKIVLNDASFDDLNMRFFEALCSGSLLLSNPTLGSGQEILFHDGEEYACHHDHDLAETIARYLADDRLREEIAERGRQRVLAAHTYRDRAEDLLQVVTGRKRDTFSPEELRQRSLRDQTGPALPGLRPSPRIRSIITTRYRSNWPTWQMVHEWEDILAMLFAVPLRPIGESCMLPTPDTLPQNYDLIFLQLAGELRFYAQNPQLIPIVMDLWRDDFDEFAKYAPKFPLIFVCNLQAFQELSPRLGNLRHLPFTLADQYLDQDLPEKDIDIIQYGRRNPLLDRFMARFLGEFPETHYLTTEAFSEEKKVRIYSNRLGEMGPSDSRMTFIRLLNRCKVSLVSTVGMDGSRNTGGIDPVSPRFLESMAAGCHLVGRIPDNEEFAATGLTRVCHHVIDYEGFRNTVLDLLARPDKQAEYRRILQQRLTSSLAPIIQRALGSLIGRSFEFSLEVFMQQRIPRTDIERRLQGLTLKAPELSESTSFMNYLTLADAIAFYREFHHLDLSDLFSQIITQQTSLASSLLFCAMELLGKGYGEAASSTAERTAQLAPSSSCAAFLRAEILRRLGRLEQSRLACMQALTQWPQLQEARAVLDMCDVAEVLPTPREHYHVLHCAHMLLQPDRYVEIGVSNGKSLALCKSGSPIGVDPLTAAPEELCFHSPDVIPALFKLTSNDFFQQGCMERIWGEQPFNMAFIDGLHLFEQALMDFIHLEHRSSPDSIIFIHDCLPVSIAGASRERNTMVWTGDVWKVIVCLKRIRPDLEIVTFPVRPSGLAMVRRLDRSSRVLANQFDTLVSLFVDAQLPESMAERFQLLNVTDTPYEEAIAEVLRQQGPWQGRQTAA